MIMEKFLEDYLWNEIWDLNTPPNLVRFPCDVIDEMMKNGWIKSPKQAYATLEKWTRKGKFNYGCSILTGWKVINE